MKIQPLQLSDIAQVAQLHATELTESRLAILGSAYLERMYSLLSNNPETNSCLVAKVATTVVGVCSFSRDLAATQRQIRQALTPTEYSVIFQAMIRLQLSPLAIIKQLYVEWCLTHQFDQPYPTILTICVKHTYQRQGIGQQLVTHVLDQLHHEGITSCYVDTLTTNQQAQQFYRSQGFHVLRNIGDSQIFKFG
jgi:ribosomal protein S18 acetylase RimI-like enzyme